jgi:transposase-like protein
MSDIPHWLIHALLVYGVSILAFALGVGCGSELRAWWQQHQRVKQARERFAKSLRVGGHS